MRCCRSTRRVIRPTLALVLAAFTSGSGRAHPEIEEALARLNAQIAVGPTKAELYLERGELYARHEDWVTAEANYLRAGEISPHQPRLALARGALALATGRLAEARAHLDLALAQEPGDAAALILRARSHAAIGARDRR